MVAQLLKNWQSFKAMYVCTKRK